MDNKKCYLRHPMTKKYNPNRIIVLKQNYRSHADILRVPSDLFYDKMLEAKGNTGIYNILFNFILFSNTMPSAD